MNNLEGAIVATDKIVDLVNRTIEELRDFTLICNGYGVLSSPSETRTHLVYAKDRIERALKLVDAATCGKEYQS